MHAVTFSTLALPCASSVAQGESSAAGGASSVAGGESSAARGESSVAKAAAGGASSVAGGESSAAAAGTARAGRWRSRPPPKMSPVFLDSNPPPPPRPFLTQETQGPELPQRRASRARAASMPPQSAQRPSPGDRRAVSSGHGAAICLYMLL